ncbi:MAG: aminoacyl-tRNA hydrolase [Flavobacteriales bacterium]|jgi:PTH1 family peptidyl-tRNA hydrolase
MKFLIVGLGNIGSEYAQTRHNIGFKVLDALAGASNLFFKTDRYGDVCELKHKGKTFILLKPSTYMNLSGNAVRYWMQQEKIALENTLVITDDLALPFGKLRMRGQGSDGGHNGLKHIQQILQTSNYPRLRFGISAEFGKGQQVDYVLGEWSDEEKQTLNEHIERAGKAVLSFGHIGLARTMNEFNTK